MFTCGLRGSSQANYFPLFDGQVRRGDDFIFKLIPFLYFYGLLLCVYRTAKDAVVCCRRQIQKQDCQTKWGVCIVVVFLQLI